MKIKKTDDQKHILELLECYKFVETQIPQIREKYPALSDSSLYQDGLNNCDTKMFECFMGEISTAKFTLDSYQEIYDETNDILSIIEKKFGKEAVILIREAYMDKKSRTEMAQIHNCSESTIKRKLKQYIREVAK